MTKFLCHVPDIDPARGKEVLVEGPGGVVCIAVFLVGGTVRAYLNACPHLGRSLSFAPDEFLFEDTGELVCPHHGACFDPATGECVAGPCKGSFLTPVQVNVDHGRVLLGEPGGIVGGQIRKPG